MNPRQSYWTKFVVLVVIKFGLLGTTYAQIMPAYYAVYSRVKPITAGTTIPNIISDNLALHYDAANANSYPGSGTTWKDLKGTGNATLNNGPSYSTSYGGMIAFDGTNDFAATNSITLSYPPGFTVEIVAKFNSISGAQGLITFNNTGASKYINFYKGNGTGMRWEVGAGQSVTGTNNLTAGVWYHFTGVYDGTTARLYRNGVLEASANLTSTTTTTASVVMGAFDNTGTYPFNGNIAIARFYTRPLSASEVLQNYNSTKIRFAELVTSGLMANLAVAPTTGNSWTDISGNGNHATLKGNPTYNSEYGGGITTSFPNYDATSYIQTGYNLGSSFTISIASRLNPSSYWATLWGNESYNAGKGYFAYLPYGGSISIGSPSGTASYTAAGIGSLALWDFVVNGTALTIYKNGTSVYTGTFTAPSGGPGTTGLYFGARHLNDGSSYTDPCPGTYYSMRVYNRALNSAEITTNFGVLRGSYGL